MIHVANGKGCDPYSGPFQETRQRVGDATSFYAWQSPRIGITNETKPLVWDQAHELLFHSLHYKPLTIVRRLI